MVKDVMTGEAKVYGVDIRALRIGFVGQRFQFFIQNIKSFVALVENIDPKAFRQHIQADVARLAAPRAVVHPAAEQVVELAQANADLAKKNGCLNCHTVDKKLVGPSLKDIAAKYKADPKAADYLAGKIQKGSQGVWGPVPMPPNAKVNDADAKTLAQWILTQ